MIHVQARISEIKMRDVVTPLKTSGTTYAVGDIVEFLNREGQWVPAKVIADLESKAKYTRGYEDTQKKKIKDLEICLTTFDASKSMELSCHPWSCHPNMESAANASAAEASPDDLCAGM